MDWLVRDSILETLIENKLWTADGDFQLSNMLRQIDKGKIELYQSFFNPHQQKSARNKLKNLKNTYNKYYSIRHCMDHLTLEGYCENLKNQYLLYHSIYISKNNEYIPISSLPNDEIDFEMLAKEINDHNIDISIFRKLSRSDIWKSYWTANKDLIFNKPTVDLTDEQRTLLVFSRMYDSARENPECPPDPVFDDDDMFDGWLLLQHQKHNDNKKSQNINNGLNSKTSKAQEVFLVAKNRNDATEIHDLNSDFNKSIIKERSNTIKKMTEVDASKLPDARREIQQQTQALVKQKLKKK